MMKDIQHPLDPQRVHANFKRCTFLNDHHIAVSTALGEILLQRMAELNLQPQRIINLVAGQSIFTAVLAVRYPQAKVVAVDYIPLQLKLEPLPFATHSVDMVFCPMLLHWCVAPAHVLQEIQRILKPNGVLLFSVLGPDTLTELRQVLLSLGDTPYIPLFTDMHHWGDLLQNLQFKNPVVDVDYFTLYYSSFAQLMLNLRTQSPTYFLRDMNKGLITPRQWQGLAQTYEAYRDEHGLALTLEVVYGIAFAPALMSQDESQVKETSIPLQKVRRKIDR